MCIPDIDKGAVFQDPVFESIEEPCGAEDEVQLDDLANVRCTYYRVLLW